MTCPYCNSKDTSDIFTILIEDENYLVPEHTGMPRSWLNCNSCGVKYSFPRLTDFQIEYMYQNYRSEEFRKEAPDDYFDRITSLSDSGSENYQRYVHISSVLNGCTPSSILDIGCGGGVLIHTLKKQWPNSSFHGIEPSPNFADLASRRTQSNVLCGYLNSQAFHRQSFNLITCCQVLEHVPDLDSFLTEIHLRMNSRSILYLEVPDHGDFIKLPKDHTRFTEPSHLWYFSLNSLIPIVENSGFNILSANTFLSKRKRNNLFVLASIKA